MMTIQTMLDAQLRLQQKSFGQDPGDLDDAGKMDWVRWNVLALQDELHEALAETGWKPWAKSQHINREAYISELVDAWHFFMNLMLVVECTPEEFVEKYFEKRQINVQRQVEGYDGVTGKCPDCKRALDDSAVTCTVDGCTV